MNYFTFFWGPSNTAMISTYPLPAISYDSEATLFYFTAEVEFASRWNSNRRRETRLYLKMKEQRDSQKCFFASSYAIVFVVESMKLTLERELSVISSFIYETRFVHNLASKIVSGDFYRSKTRKVVERNQWSCVARIWRFVCNRTK